MTAALIADSVSKKFDIQRNRPATLKESLIRRLSGQHRREGAVWALREVSFSLEQGRSLGIIGHNGAGKSTLLRLLCGLGRPTTGDIHRKGQVGALLELGSGLHLEMTGRENILTAGILNGLTRQEVFRRREEIIAFAELEDFIDQPVRTYSSGMYMRLAFSTAIHFDPDILMVDEVLAVGDVRFREKCLDKLRAFQVAGKTLVFVSHDTEQIRSLCGEALVLEEGRVITHSDPEEAIRCYHELMRKRTERRATQISVNSSVPTEPAGHGSRLGTQEASILSVVARGSYGAAGNVESGNSAVFELDCQLVRPLPDMALTLGVFSETNAKCFELALPSVRQALGSLSGRVVFQCSIPKIPLQPGRYYVNVGLYPTDWDFVYDYHWQMHSLTVSNPEGEIAGLSGVVMVRPQWSVLQKSLESGAEFEMKESEDAH